MKNMNLGLAVLALFSVGIIANATAQNKPSKSTTVHHAPVRHRNSGVAVPDHSKNMNADLAKLEGQTSRAIKPARRTPQNNALPAKAFQQDRRNNPPINFGDSGKAGHGARSGGGARATASPAKAGPRMR